MISAGENSCCPTANYNLYKKIDFLVKIAII